MTTNFIRTLWLATLVLLCANVCLFAQPEAATGSAVGSILDQESSGIPDVAVLIEGKGRQWNTSSDKQGEFAIDLPAGTYRFTLQKDGFMKLIVTDFIVPSGIKVAYRFDMRLGGCSDCDWKFEDPLLPEETLSTSVGRPVTPSLLPQSAPNISVNGYASTDKVQRGRIVQVAVVMDIPKGYHVNSNRPLESFLKATQLKVDAPSGARAGAVAYPRALLRSFSFSKDKLSVYEGRVILRFNVTVPANFGSGSMQLKAKLNYQSCSEALCFPPQSREVKVEIPVVGANEAVKRINGEYFGRSR